MFPEMDFTEPLLNEPYILSPYKLCVATYLLSYMEVKNSCETSGKPSPNSLTHCHLGFKLIMSLDCSYQELCSQMMSPLEVASTLPKVKHDDKKQQIDEAVLKRFDSWLEDIQLGGISRLHEFVKKLHKILNKRATPSSRHQNQPEELYRVNRLSMAGLFLRKFLIHFERLLFSDVDSLYDQLCQYLKSENDYDYLPIQPVNHATSVKQVAKILINEHASLPPPAIVDFINFYFEQNNRYHYNQFIQLNYKTNLNMIKRMSALEGGQGGTGTGTNGTNAATGANIPGANFITNGTGQVQITGALANRKVKDLFKSINFYSDIYYLKFINALRVNNFTAAQECFFTFFDLKKATQLGNTGPSSSSAANGAANESTNKSALQTSGSNFCWSALNLAIMYAHFTHYRLAYEALTDCISVAREQKDERCLQYAMIWLLHVLQKLNAEADEDKKDSSGDLGVEGSAGGAAKTTQRSASLDKAKAVELSHRYHKTVDDLNLVSNLLNLIATNELTLPYIAAMALLHLEKALYCRPIYPNLSDHAEVGSGLMGKTAAQVRRPPLTTKPILLAVRHLMNDVLIKSYATHAAVLNAYGAVHLGAVQSKILARLELVDMIDNENISHVCEEQAIAVRNLAIYDWAIRGRKSEPLEQLLSFGRLISPYNSSLRSIIEQAAAEINFEAAIYQADWTAAQVAIDVIKLSNRSAALMMSAEMYRRQKEPIAALEALNQLLREPYSEPYLWIAAQVTKASLLADLSALLDCVVKAQAHGFRILETRALLEIARLQRSMFGQCGEAQAILNSLFLRLSASSRLVDLATAYFLTAENHFAVHLQGRREALMEAPIRWKRQHQPPALSTGWSALEAASWANERAILIWKRVGERMALFESLTLQALLEGERGSRETRNYYARQANAVRVELLK